MGEASGKLLERATHLLYRHSVGFLVFFFILTGIGGYYASQLQLTADFAALLPQDLQSVKDVDRVSERLGGVGNFVIVVENKNFEAAKRYTEDLVERLKKLLPQGVIRFIDYRIDEQRAFVEKYKYLYVSLEDLQEIHDRLKAQIERDTVCRNPFYLDFTGDCKKKFDISEIEKKYDSGGIKYEKYRDNYYTNQDSSLLAILIKPTGNPTTISQTREFLKALVPVIYSLDPKAYDPSLTLHFTGNYPQADEEQRTMVKDVTSTAIACILLVALVLFFYYRRVRTIVFITVSVGMGLAWTYGLAYPLVGVLTSLTAFMGSIVLGNGINNAIIFLARYLEERRRGVLSAEDATVLAARQTIGATFTASFTTAAAFLVLRISELRAYEQFGLLGCIGMILCWISAYAILPCLISVAERVHPMAVSEMDTSRTTFTGWIGRLVERAPGTVALVGLGLTVAGAIGSYVFWSDPYEHDYSNIRSERAIKNGSAYWNIRLMEEVFDVSLTPVPVLADSPAHAQEITDLLLAKRDADPGSMIANVRTFGFFVPDKQEEKLAVIKNIRKLLEAQALKFLTADQRKELDKLKDSFDLTPITASDVPESIRRHFRETDGHLDRVAYVFPDNTRFLWIVENVFKFAGEVRKTQLSDGTVITASSESVIIADILAIVHRDAPRIILSAFAAILVLLLFNFRSIPVAFKVFLPLGAAYLWLGLWLELAHIRITFLNFIVLPMAIGIGMDYSANIFHRYEIEGEGSIEDVLRTTGGAVLLCSLTTIIGYASLLVAQSGALVGFGRLGLLSELSTVSAALLFAPAVLVLLERRRGGHRGTEGS